LRKVDDFFTEDLLWMKANNSAVADDAQASSAPWIFQMTGSFVPKLVFFEDKGKHGLSVFSDYFPTCFWENPE